MKFRATVCLIGEASRSTPTVWPLPMEVALVPLDDARDGEAPALGPENMMPKLMSAVLVSSTLKTTFMSPNAEPWWRVRLHGLEVLQVRRGYWYPSMIFSLLKTSPSSKGSPRRRTYSLVFVLPLKMMFSMWALSVSPMFRV